MIICLSNQGTGANFKNKLEVTFKLQPATAKNRIKIKEKLLIILFYFRNKPHHYCCPRIRNAVK